MKQQRRTFKANVSTAATKADITAYAALAATIVVRASKCGAAAGAVAGKR
jgi:hypothetical protein